MPQVWDAETEALRRELTQLSPKELLALAHQEGVRTAGRAAAEIVEALLKMDCDADAAASAPQHAPGKLAYHRDQPPHRHAGTHSSSAHKQQPQHMHQGHLDFSNSQDLSVHAVSKQQQQQHELHRRSANSMPPPAAATAAAPQQPVAAGLQRRQHQQEQQSDYLHAQQLHRHHQQQQQQQQRGRHSDHEQELQHESSFTFTAAAAAAAAGARAGSHAERSSGTAQISAARRTHGDDGRAVPYQDQVYTDRPSADAYVPSAAAALITEMRGGGGGSGRISSRRGSGTPPHPSREAFKQQQNMVLESKMQQLEQSLQQLQRSPRVTPPHHEPLSAQYNARSSGNGSYNSGGGGGSSADRTNRRLWSSPSVSAGSQHSPAPAAAAGAGSGYSQPPMSPSSRHPASRSGAHAYGRSPEPFTSAASSGRGGSRPRAIPAAAPAAAGVSAGNRPTSSGGGAYSNRSSSNILAEHAAQRPSAAAGSAASTAVSTAERQPAPSPSPSPQPAQARSLSMSPAPAKGTPRVGVMPCQKAMLRKAAQEAAKAATAAGGSAGGASAGGSKPHSAEHPASSSRGDSGSSGGVSGSSDRPAPSSNGMVRRSAVSNSGGLMRNASSLRGGTPEPPFHSSSRAAAGATTPAAANRASSSKGNAVRPVSPGIWPPAGPPPSPKVSAGRAPASTSGCLTAAGHSAGRVSASVTGAVSAEPEERRRVKGPFSVQADTAGVLGTVGVGAERPRSSRARTSHEAINASTSSSGRTSLSGRISASRSARGGAVTPPRSALTARAASARGAASLNGGSSGSSTPLHQRGQQQNQQHILSMTGTGLAGRARQLLAGSPVLARRAREGSVSAATGSTPAKQQEQQQQGPATAEKQPQLLHTPMRVRSTAAGATAPSRTSVLSQQPAAVTGYSTPIASKTRSMASTAAAAVSAAVTPARQHVRAFGDAFSAAYGSCNATPSEAAGQNKAPLAGTAAAAAAAAASDGPAVMIGGMMTPKGVVMGSARRVASCQARTAMAAVAAASQDTTAMSNRAGCIGGAAPAPVTPLHKGARRTVPSDAAGHDEVDKHLQALVERCLRIRNPDAHKLALQGPEPAKRWLQQHLIGPWKRAGAGNTTSSGRSNAGGPCMAAGYCSRSLLLHGPSGSGKTELVHAVAAEMGANLLYVPGGESLLKTYQQEGHRLLRALFAVARRVAPCVVCFDDAHINFPSSVSRMSDPGGAASIALMIIEIEVHLQQLADMQANLEAAAAQLQAPHSVQKPTVSSSGRVTPGRGSKSSSGGGSGEGSGLRPVWGFFGCKAKSKSKEQSPEEVVQKKQHQGGYARMAGPVVVVFVTHRPEALDGALLQQLPVQLQLELPAAEAREDLLMGWLMEREAAVNVQDVEWLARQTEGFSCSELLRLCQQAARQPAQERSQRAICMSDLEVALDTMQQQQTTHVQQQPYQAQHYQQQHYQVQQKQQQYMGSSSPMRRHHPSE